jgi:hypothetical protein
MNYAELRQDLTNQIRIAEYKLKLLDLSAAAKFDFYYRPEKIAPNISHTIRPWQFGSSWKTSVETHNK